MADEKKNQTTDETEAQAAPAPEAEADAAEPVAEAEPSSEETPVEEKPVEAEPSSEETPVEEEPAAPEPAAEAEPQAPAQPEPKKKRKRLPRSLRPQKTRPRRPATTGKRKPIAPATRPSDVQRGRRQERRGVVVSNAMDKTIVVKVDVIKSHPRYKKVVRRSVKFHAHDEQNAANVGDVVRIVETRPMSATKRWRLAEIVEAAK